MLVQLVLLLLLHGLDSNYAADESQYLQKNSSGILPETSSLPLISYSRELFNPIRTVHKDKREVPISSYTRSGYDGATAYKPATSGQETFSSDGSFTRTYKSEDGTTSTMSGYQKPLPSGLGQAMQGQFSYQAPDGSTVQTRWTADERGFRAEGAHIPVLSIGFGRRR